MTSAKLNDNLRALPSVDELLRTDSARRFADANGAAAAATASRVVVDMLRDEILAGSTADVSDLMARAERMLEHQGVIEQLSGIRRVINATGVMIHTNLGRAPLSAEARAAMVDASGYCTLEYDLDTGKRGHRGVRAERLIAELTGAEDAIVVNNCAAAAFFVLSVFAAGGEVVISRGELVEIGGDFRVPDVLAASGATLREVGTTNRTKLSDYERAIGADTRMILRVHPSNYRVIGFTSAPGRDVLVTLAHSRGCVYFEDVGSGALVDLSPYGLSDEPVVSRVIADGADLVSFSGDKLLGGPQCGIITGRRELIDELRKHPLQRALRVDKKTLAALGATLGSYRRSTHFREIPVLSQLSMTYEAIRSRAESLKGTLQATLKAEVIDGESVLGGGAAPDVHPRTALLALTHVRESTEQLERALRTCDTPVIARIEGGRVLLDLRTVDPADDPALATILSSLS